MNACAQTPRGNLGWPRRIALAAALALLAAALAGCGGSNDSDPAVTTIAAANARYSRQATLSINGRNLRAGIVVDMEGGCEDLTPVANGTDDLQQYTCVVLAVGEHKAHIHATDGSFLGSLTFQVPQPEVSLTTSKGAIVVELDAVKAPVTSRNFLNYVGTGFYRNVLIHAAKPDRGIATGGYTSGLVVKNPTQPAITLESANGLKHLRGTLGMLRGEAFDSATSQWFVNAADNADLDYVDAAQPGYAVFGRVLSGMEVVDAITAVPTRVDAKTGLTDVPVTEILITAATQTR